MTVDLDKLAADAQAISTTSPNTRRFALDLVEYLREQAQPIPPVPPTPPDPVPPTPPSAPIRELDFSTGDTSQWLGDEVGVGCSVTVVPGPGPNGEPYLCRYSVPGPTAGNTRNRAQTTLDTFDV